MRQAGDIQGRQAEDARPRPDRTDAPARAPGRDAERRLALEHEVSRVLTRAADLDDALHGVLRAVRDGLGVHVCALWLPADDATHVRCVRCLAADHMPELATFVETTRRWTFAAGEGMPGRVWASGRPEWLERVDDPGFRRRPAALASGLRAGAALPLHDASKCIGVIEWFSCEDLPREDRVLATMEAVGTDLAQFLRRSEAERALRQRNDRLALIAKASADLVLREAGERGVLGEVFRDVARALGYELMFHYEGDGDGLRLVASDGLEAAEREAFARLAPGEHLCGRVAQHREPLVVEDLSRSPYAEAAGLCSAGVLCYVGVPLVAQDELVGTVSFATRRRAHAAEGDLQLIQALADLAAVQLARARSEQRLRDRETHLGLALEASQAVAFEWDVVHDRVRHLQQAATPTGRLPAQSTFADVVRLVHPDDRVAFRAAVDAALASAGGDYAAEFRHLLPDGRVRWIAERGRVAFDASGRALRLVGVAHDITQRRQAEDALRASEARYRHMFEGNPQPMWVFDAQTLRFLAVNDAAIAKYGYTREEFLAMSIADIRPAEDLPRLQAMVSEAPPARLTHAGDWRHRRKDGVLVDVEITTHGIEFAGRPARLVLVHDVTDRKAAERQLRENEERLRFALQGASAGTWELDVTSGAVRWSPEQYLIYDVDPVSGPPTLDIWESRLHPADRDALLRELDDIVHARMEQWRTEFRVLWRDGTQRWVLGLGRAQYEADGRPSRISGLNIDITERKKTEEALKEADRRKDEFLAMLAHELRNPLAPIRNATELLRLASPKDGTIEAARGMIERQVSHMVRLVDDLLDVSRVSRGKITLATDTLDLAAVVRQAIETSRPPLDARRHRLAVAMPAEPLRVQGDFTRLAQVIANLLDNAAKYTAPGGRIDVIVGREGEGGNARAVVRVRDTGRGLDGATIPHLFELFYQADRNLDRTEGGLGIGLSLVKSLVEMHGGEVEARSEGLGTGSEFVVRLPLVAASGTSAAVGERTAATAIVRGLRILVVDDNRDSAESTALLLRIDGHEVTTVYDGRRAVEVAVQDKPAVVLLDVGLPNLDGYEACRAMRAAGLTDTLIVTMTGYGQDEDRRRSQEAGFDAHHVKPIELDALRALIAGRAAREASASADGRVEP